MKTPEELAEEILKGIPKDSEWYNGSYNGFLAGYQAAVPQWVSVKDRLPQFIEPVLLFTGHEYEIGRLEESDGMFSVWVNDRYGAEMDADKLTHWMPLPEPPKEEG